MAICVCLNKKHKKIYLCKNIFIYIYMCVYIYIYIYIYIYVCVCVSVRACVRTWVCSRCRLLVVRPSVCAPRKYSPIKKHVYGMGEVRVAGTSRPRFYLWRHCSAVRWTRPTPVIFRHRSRSWAACLPGSLSSVSRPMSTCHVRHPRTAPLCHCPMSTCHVHRPPPCVCVLVLCW
jgi:hypothetical protein